MAKRMLNETGMMRVMWRLLKERPGNSITLTQHEIDMPNLNDAIAIYHDEKTNSFTLRLEKRAAVEKSNLIIPRMN